MIFLGGIRIRSQEGTNTTPKLKDHSVSPAQKSCWMFLKHNEKTPHFAVMDFVDPKNPWKMIQLEI